MKRLLVTGGLGLCGRAIAEAARGNGCWEVFTTSRSASSDKRHIVHDLLDPIDPAGGKFPDRLDAIVHAAAQVDQTDRSFDVVMANTRTAYNLAEFAAAAGCRQFVHLSSVAVYGAPALGNAVSEETPARPQSPYGLSKLLAESILSSWHAHYDSLLHLRLGYVAGAGMSDDTIVRRLARSRVAGEGVTLVNPAITRIQFIDADDVAAVCVAALACNLSGTINLAGRVRHSIEDLWQEIARAIPGKTPVSRLAALDAAYDTHYRTDKLDELNLPGQTPFSATIDKAVAGLRSDA